MGDLFAVDASADRRSLSPTDLAQFIRLEQCERYLRLRLHERDGNGDFMRDYGVAPASIPPILTRSGATFEATVMAAIPAAYAPFNCATDVVRSGPRTDDNARIVEAVATLAPGTVHLIFQPRLAIRLGDWHVRGDLDILRLARTPTGDLHILIADIKSSTAAKVEHRLQVACYAEMVTALLDSSGIPVAHIDLGILYRGPNDPDRDSEHADAREREIQAQAATDALGVAVGLLELIPDPDAYRQDVRDLVTGEGSLADRVIEMPFAVIPYHLTYKCDGCLYNEFCMKWSAEHDDLSLLPHLETAEKSTLSRAGIATMRQLARLKEPPEGDDRGMDLVPTPDTAALVRTVTALPRVGSRLDELIHRARRYRKWRGDNVTTLPFIPSKGYGTLPYCDATHDPNLVRIYIDAQHDYLEDRVYMVGALVAACENGVESPARRRSIVHLTDGPPDTVEKERDLFTRWADETLRAVVELAAPDADGAARAPIHLIFYNSFARESLLDGLGRHLREIFGATPLYDFVTQLAGFDSPIATFLDREMRELKNYPMVCQSLQAVAAYLGFDWNPGTPYRRLFRERMFDWWGKLDPPDGEPEWYAKRARFNSQIPLEYAYAAWDVIAPSVPGRSDGFAAYRPVTVPILTGFHARRLEAMERIVKDFKGNDRTSKRPFMLPELATFAEKAPSLAHAIHEFVTIERHVALNTWQGARHAPPERRVLGGETLLVRYDAALPENAAYEENRRRRALRDEFRQAFLAANPGRVQARYTPDQRAATEPLREGGRVRLHIDCAGIECNLGELLALCNLREGDWLTLFPRWTVDSRLPLAEQVPFTPTPKQLLYGMRCILRTIAVVRDGAGGIAEAYADIELVERTGRNPRPGFVFRGREHILADGEQYALDTDPNDINAQRYLTVAEEIIAIAEDGDARHVLYDRLTGRAGVTVPWPEAAVVGQTRFLTGVAARKDFEESKHRYIGGHGDAAMLLVQGPPGTGKSFATAYALFARVQGAMAAGRPFRVFVSCRTHAAIDVLIAKLADVRAELLRLREDDPTFFAAHFDDRLLALPLLRMDPKVPQPVGVAPLAAGDLASVLAEEWCVVGATPSAIYRMIRDQWGDDDLIGHRVCDCLVLDEASQMNLPETMLAALPLSPDGQVIVVGDHRQMPPIIIHDWAGEARRTFAEYRSYESVFLAFRARTPAMIKFTESFRLHKDMAAFLGREIYQQDGIDFFSRQTAVLPPFDHADPFVSSVLAPAYPLVVVVHDEAESQTRNPFEAGLIAPVLEALADAATYALDPFEGLGVVVPHRAQRALLREAIPCLTITDPTSGTVEVSSVDTVERFQGGERDAIVVSTTESDREYLLTTSTFLLDPRRLTVAISRAKRKVILVASRSVFDLFSADEETFANAQLWKNLVRRTCTVKLWQGERGGKRVTVWGNAPVPGDRIAD